MLVGHVGGDDNPNHIDATLVVSMANWIMAELVRVLHDLSIEDAQRLVESLAERRTPLIWQGKNVKRVLDPRMSLPDRILLLAATTSDEVETEELLRWCDYDNRSYFFTLIRDLHSKRMLELADDEKSVEILPPGAKKVSKILEKYQTQD